jgi:hypothetical protein
VGVFFSFYSGNFFALASRFSIRHDSVQRAVESVDLQVSDDRMLTTQPETVDAILTRGKQNCRANYCNYRLMRIVSLPSSHETVERNKIARPRKPLSIRRCATGSLGSMPGSMPG